ncbi:hypothetical protein TKK_0003117 [Trichogramma kaykai]|uniref:m7GpppN-mRNA hydrolase n=1 Tax=Trichogramma kaykai TaxID=54128 RepID=A0ABD2WS91_9HYME
MSETRIPSDILDDLSSRFIINIPEDERKDNVRLCFQIELAHWFYLDFYCTEENPKLTKVGMKEFAAIIFKHIDFLRPHASQIDVIYQKWRFYKQNVPTFGAIIMNKSLTKVLLVQSQYASSWGFPKGKINEDETTSDCAAREVLEETGFDISPLLQKHVYIESIINEQVIRLYVIPGVPEDTKFEPRTRNEIKSIQWFDLNDLPNHRKDMRCKAKLGVVPNQFFMAIPFVNKIKEWASEEFAKTGHKKGQRNRHKSVGDINSADPQNQYREKKCNSDDENAFSTPNTTGWNKNENADGNTGQLMSHWKPCQNKNSAKNGSKRNLFGKNCKDKLLAKELKESPFRQKSNSLSKNFTDKTTNGSDNTGNRKNGSKKKDKRDNNVNNLTNKTDQPMQEKLNGVARHAKTASDSSAAFNFTTKLWKNFNFDKQSIIECLMFAYNNTCEQKN